MSNGHDTPKQTFDWPIRVYYEDTDAAGIVYYANYLRYLERARTEWLRQAGFEHQQLAGQYGILFAVKNLSIDYIRPGRLDEQLIVSTGLLQRRAASLDLHQTISNSVQQQLSAAEVCLVCLHADSLKVSPIPEPIIQGLIHGG